MRAERRETTGPGQPQVRRTTSLPSNGRTALFNHVVGSADPWWGHRARGASQSPTRTCGRGCALGWLWRGDISYPMVRAYVEYRRAQVRREAGSDPQAVFVR
jgi:hypothetical protein